MNVFLISDCLWIYLNHSTHYVFLKMRELEFPKINI